MIRLPAVNLAKVGYSCLVNNVIFTAEYAEEMFEIRNREWGRKNRVPIFHLPYSLFSLPD